MIKHWMLRTYGEHYDPWQGPITAGVEEPWMVRPADRKLMTDGDQAMLYLMNPKTANGREGKVIFAVGEIRIGSSPAATGDQATPASAVQANGAGNDRNGEVVTVRYTKVLERPVPFGELDAALTATGRVPRILKNVQLISAAIEPEDRPIIEALTRQA